MVEAKNLRLVAHTDLNGHGDAMHVNIRDGIAYVGHMGASPMATSILDVEDPSRPRVIRQLERLPGTHSHKVQLVDDILVVNHERNPREKATATEWSAGIAVYDVSEMTDPKQVGFLSMAGPGVHRPTYWEAPYAYLSGSDEGYGDQFLIIADLTDPANPVEVGRWWMDGMRTGAGEEPRWPIAETTRVGLHHALVRGDRAYCGWRDQGLVILDVADKTNPTLVSHLPFDPAESNRTHTAMPVPGRDLLLVTDESVRDNCDEIPKRVRVVDIADETNPKVVGKFPVPEGDFCDRGGRFGPHNLHEPRPGSLLDGDHAYLTYFNAGIRVYDITDPTEPTDIAHYIPDAPAGQDAIQLNDLYVHDDGLIYVTDRHNGGLFILEFVGT